MEHCRRRTDGEMNDVKLSHKVKVILGYLLDGGIIKHGEHEIGMTDTHDIGYVFRNENNEPSIGGLSFMECGDFIRMVDKMSEHDYLQITFNKVLRSFNKER